jgi:cytochrome c oxidase subunit 4
MRPKPLALAWFALMLLLAATIAASFLPIGEWRQAINLNIAGAKAAVILWIFMKLRVESTLVRLTFAASGVLLLVLATMLTADYHLRPQVSTSPVGPDSRAKHLSVVFRMTAPDFPVRPSRRREE